MERLGKGKSVIALPKDFVVIDTETTGLDFDYCSLIEVSAIRYKDDTPVSTFSSLIKPPLEEVWSLDDGDNGTWIERYVDEFITELTGITNEMLASAPTKDEVIPTFLDFVQDSILIGHNVSFDINFLYDASMNVCGRPLQNDHINTMRLAHKVFPDLDHYRLADVAAICEVDQARAHRGLVDCETTAQCYLKMKRQILSTMSEDDFVRLFRKKRNACSYTDYIDSISLDELEKSDDSPILGKTVVFTGTLERMARKDALLLVAKLSGIPADSITKKTNLLVVGNGEFAASVKEGRTGKMKKAEALALKGYDIQIISENAFFDLISE